MIDYLDKESPTDIEKVEYPFVLRYGWQHLPTGETGKGLARTRNAQDAVNLTEYWNQLDRDIGTGTWLYVRHEVYEDKPKTLPTPPKIDTDESVNTFKDGIVVTVDGVKIFFWATKSGSENRVDLHVHYGGKTITTEGHRL